MTAKVPENAALTDLLAEAKQLRDLIYYNAAPNSMVETHANRLGRVLFLIEKQVTRPLWRVNQRPGMPRGPHAARVARALDVEGSGHGSGM